MTLYPFETQLVLDGSNPATVVFGGSVTLYNPTDTNLGTPLSLVDHRGLPLSNPVQVNPQGFIPAFQATLPQVMWAGNGYRGYLNSFQGVLDAALDAQAAAEAAAVSGAEAADSAEAAAAAAEAAVASGSGSGGVAGHYLNAVDYGFTTSASAAANTSAFISASSAAKTAKKSLYIPAGTYQTNGLSFASGNGNIRVFGAGRDRTILVNNHATNPSFALHGTAGGPYGDNTYLEDVTLNATAKRAGQVGISTLLAVYPHVDRVAINDHGIGVKHEASWNGVYDQVLVDGCDTGWLFPTTNYTPSSPMTFRNCSALGCGVGIDIRFGLEATSWIGGDIIENGTGMNLVGTQSRALSFTALNFERNIGDDIVIGDATNGPSSVAFIGCRFLRASTGARSVKYQRGSTITMTSCSWDNYTVAVRQDSTTGALVMTGCVSSGVAQFIDSNGVNFGMTPIFASTPNQAARISTGSQSNIRQIAAADGLGTKSLSGAGKTTVTDADFVNQPFDGFLAVVRNTTDNTSRLAVRANGTWQYINLS